MRHAPVILDDELVCSDVHFWARELRLVAARREATHGARCATAGVVGALCAPAGHDLRRSVHVDVWPREVLQADHSAAGGDGGEARCGDLHGREYGEWAGTELQKLTVATLGIGRRKDH